MEKENVKVSFIGMDPSDALKEYAMEKILRKDEFVKEATYIEMFFKESKYTRGVENDFRFDVNIVLPNATVRVEQEGPDMYANIDMASDTLNRRLRRYRDRKVYWEGKKPWKVLEAEAALQALTDEVEDNLDDYSDYVPKIATRKELKKYDVLEEGEAIERMELAGYDQYLFKNRMNQRVAMVYKRKNGGYGLVEVAKS